MLLFHLARKRSAFDGGVSLSALEQLGDSVSYLAFGEQMRASADELTRAGLPGTLLPTVTGLQQTDTLLQCLSRISGRPIAEKYHMQRSQLLDAMIDNARNLGHMRAAIAAEPDLLFDLSAWLCELGARPRLAVSPTRAETLHRLPVDRVYIGDYQLLEFRIDACNLLLAPDSARTLAREQHLAHYAIGLHEQRHVGAQHLTRMGYRGARDQLFHLVNLLM
jgi:nitrogenase molybdenum-iron protein NifN